MGARPLTHLSLRNRELFYLGVVGILTGLGFASVYIARQAAVSWGSLSYALFFFALGVLIAPLRPVAVGVSRPTWSRGQRCRTPTRTCCRWRGS